MAKPNKSIENRDAIKRLRGQGLSFAAIGKQLGMGRSTVNTAWNKIMAEEARLIKWPRLSSLKDNEITEIYAGRRYG